MEDGVSLLKPPIGLFRVKRQQFDRNVRARSADGASGHSGGGSVVSIGVLICSVENCDVRWQTREEDCDSDSAVAAATRRRSVSKRSRLPYIMLRVEKRVTNLTSYEHHNS